MIKSDFVIENNVVEKGIGKMFYQDGFPIVMAIERFKRAGIGVNLMAIISELRENGWSDKTIKNKLIVDFQDSGEKLDLSIFNETCKTNN